MSLFCTTCIRRSKPAPRSCDLMDTAQQWPCRWQCQVAKYTIGSFTVTVFFLLIDLFFLKGRDIPTSACWWTQSTHQEDKRETFFVWVIFSFMCTWCSIRAQFTPNIIGLAVKSKEQEPHWLKLQPEKTVKTMKDLINTLNKNFEMKISWSRLTRGLQVHPASTW